MSTISFSIAPDIAPQRLPGWYIFATWLSKQINTPITTTDFSSFEKQKQALLDGKIDFLYANPYDAGWLVREQKFIALAQPTSDVAEVTVVAKVGGAITAVVDIPKGVNVAAADNADLRMLGAILLEPANLTKDDFTFVDVSNHILAIKALLSGKADIAMIPTKIFNGLSKTIANDLNPLVSTQARDIESVAHCFVLSPQMAEFAEPIKQVLKEMKNLPNGQSILDDIGVTDWKILENKDEIAFMIDLIYALQV
ncbi:MULTISPECIES: PhnD/SsuA/transferrin family substrate-binding protein [Wohlfahrtiimonas]|uniref:PhnD/SsuA/transferrin family substrate-binding protein n=1 Tax=Wohlfahrtiimonas TaxID=582472 RepID=UPI000B98826E|nr:MULTISPECIES: PhnD/SsuA/transferrin family substrate-binding protein [Wohlfahrtiimonas]OYQ74519.1 hypothetical protein B9T20_04430 [Wohlfahrtiimonas sp. G9077]OYQ87837.1 hypothetical protein B9T21_06165 [Wohlfahrtiimonas chitiniclastica]